MELDPSRLRRGEWIAGFAAVVLLALMFAVGWYRPHGGAPSLNGWHTLAHLRWLIMLTVLVAFLLVLVQATRRAPALPVTMSTLLTVLSGVTVLWMAYRVLIQPPPHEQAAAFLGLASACGVALGAFLSLRQEGIAARDEPAKIPVVGLGAGTDS